jgi:prefoldin subunit 5
MSAIIEQAIAEAQQKLASLKDMQRAAETMQMPIDGDQFRRDALALMSTMLEVIAALQREIAELKKKLSP